MIRIRRHDTRGRVDHGWLLSRHTFPFGCCRDDDWPRFRALRVINEDRIRATPGLR